MNAGERDELLIKLKLIEMRDNGVTPAFLGVPITQLGFVGKCYGSLPQGLSLNGIRNNNAAIVSACTAAGVLKAPTSYKSDVYINGKGYSLKSLSAAPPALVNHTARLGFETACNHSGVNIATLDQIIDNYWALRLAGTIGEDVANSNPHSPFAAYQAYMEPILEYFLFTGSGAGVSTYPSDFILDYKDPLNENTWHSCCPQTAVALLWPKLIFSVRATKGMPTNYCLNNYCGPNAQSIARWVRQSSGKYRGALHIRSK